jgi:hypothetical protein
MPAPRRDPSKPHSREWRGVNRQREVVVLPPGGCDDPVPPLPDGREWTPRERDRWQSLWQSPQATMWDESAAATVASLVIYETMLLEGKSAAWSAQELRHCSTELGLTPAAMKSLGWRIGGADD